MEDSLQAYYRDLDAWLGPGGVQGWLAARERRRKIEQLKAKIKREREAQGIEQTTQNNVLD